MLNKHTSSLLYLFVFFLFTGCSTSDSQANEISVRKGSAFYKAAEKTSETVAFIYEYNAAVAELEWKAVELKTASGDQLRDAIRAFITNNQEKGACPNLKLKKVELEANSKRLYFSGKPDFKAIKDSTIFWTAMEMTISRNTDLNYDIEFE